MIGALILTVRLLATAYTPGAVVSLTIAFVMIAGGNSVFGVLTNPASRMLGETTYSMYLLHGLLLSVTIQFVIGIPVVAGWSSVQYWLLILGLTLPLVFISYLGFRWVELPGQRAAPAILGWLRRGRRRRPATAEVS